MLHFVLGKVSSGKTTYLHNMLGKALDKNEENAVLIVPEQFTFETDKGILTALGAEKSNRVEVYSFTRLAQSFLDEYGYEKRPVISEQGRLIFMSRALKGLQDKLEIYKNHIDDSAFIRRMILFVNEFRQSDNDTEHMRKTADLLPDGVLKRKMNELMLICDAYEAIIENSYIDTTDVLSEFYDLLLKNNCFCGKTVAIDGFSSFNAQILKIIGEIMVQCDDMYIALTADGVGYKEGQNDVFAFTRRTASRLRSVADKKAVPVSKPIIISSETTGFSPYASEYLSHLENNFYKPSFEVCAGKTEDINIYCACDIDDECAYAARKIRQLNRDGVRCRDIAVIFRDEEKYENKLKAAFRKYRIPVFEDRREPIANQPLILYVQAILNICAHGFSSENIMRLLKTGLSELSVAEISEIENYVYIWQIDGSAWKKEWTMNPLGFSEKTPDKSVLEHINEMREAVVLPLAELRESLKDIDGEEFSRQIYIWLRDNAVDERLRDFAIALEEDGEFALALEQEQIWDILMETLDECAVSLKGEKLSAARYLDIFELSLSARSLGKIPNGIDEVIVGSASRIKTRNTDYVFVVGLNSGVFPAIASDSGILTDKEKTVLLENGLELFDINKYKSTEEKFIAYNAVCHARKKVFLSYALRGTSMKDDKKTYSEIISFVTKQFPDIEITDYRQIKTEEKIEGADAAFEILAENMRNDNFYAKNLFEYFSRIPEYRKKLESLKRASGDLDFKFEDPKNAKELFGVNMYLSASKVEEYKICPFKYFCHYGMNTEPRKKASLDPSQSGTVIHYVLENIVRKYSDIGIENVSKEEKSSAIRRILGEYAQNVLGGLEDKQERFEYLFARFAKILDTLVERLSKEFENSSFKPCDFELEIGGDEIATYSIELENEGKISIHGYIDRVDAFVHDGKKYLRVVDYKTGNKEMLLSDVLSGINMQMLIYLFALWKNGNKKYEGDIIPAGVLYFPARFSPFSAERNDDSELISEKIMKAGKMNGIILDDSRVIRAMDENSGCVFIPIKINKSGKMSGNLISLEQLRLLNDRIDKILSDMALSLHRGIIPAFPVSGKNHEHTCEYCDYKSVCGHEKSGKYRHIEPEKFEESIERLERGEE